MLRTIRFRHAALLAALALPAALGAQATRAPRKDGRVPILEYHLIGGEDGRWSRSAASFRKDLELLYARGYRPVTVSEVVDKKLDIPAGTSPVVFTFDDASPGQFRYIERNGQLEVDPESAVGIWLAFSAKHPDWRKKATFCLLPAAAAGHAFFGDKGIEGQKTEWRFKKVRFLAEQGFELCNHTLWHAQLNKYDDRMVQEQIARGVLAIDSAVAGYRVRTFALPLGLWPRNRALAFAGSWTNPKTRQEVRYQFDAVLEVSGQPSPGPWSAGFNPHSLNRQQVLGNSLANVLDKLEATRLVVGGAP
jgi:peptidoglycan/xylan/chitin deacetylase (PgdA/CDA1 family)